MKRKKIRIVRPTESIVDGELKKVGEIEIGESLALIVPVSSREQSTLAGVYGIVTHRATIQPPPDYLVKVGDEAIIDNKRYRVVAVNLYDIGTVLDRLELLLEAVK